MGDGTVTAGEGLSLTVLGCDGSYAGPGGAASGYLVQAAGTRVWMDAGPGTLANLQRHVPLDQLDAVVLSHEHPDHRSDLDGLGVAFAYVLDRGGLPVYAPEGLRRRLYHEPSGVFEWHQVGEGDEVAIGSLALRFSRTDHSPLTLAMRVEAGGATLGYSADTGPEWSLEGLGPGLDLALCEATHLRDDEGRLQHLSARQAGVSARAAGAGVLVLTHRWPTVSAEASREEGSEAFGSAVALASIGDRYQVGRSPQ